MPVFSSTKGVTAVGAQPRRSSGACSTPMRPSRPYWPEFAAAGKEAITVRPGAEPPGRAAAGGGRVHARRGLSWDPMVEPLAAQAPLWEPGTAARLPHAHLRLARRRAPPPHHRPHPGHVPARRGRGAARPRLLGRPARGGGAARRRARPAEVDLRRGARAVRRDLLLARVFANPGGHFDYDDMWNTRQLHACELPSSTASATPARWPGCTRALVGDGVDGAAPCRPETIAVATTEQVRGPDAVIGVESCFGLGFMLGASFGAANPRRVRPRRRRRLARLRRSGRRHRLRLRDERPPLRRHRRPPQRGPRASRLPVGA